PHRQTRDRSPASLVSRGSAVLTRHRYVQNADSCFRRRCPSAMLNRRGSTPRHVSGRYSDVHSRPSESPVMADVNITLPQLGFGQTRRRDAWWVTPALSFVVLTSFVTYATWAAFQGVHYYYGPYLSPFYSPEIFGDSPHSWFGPKPA